MPSLISPLMLLMSDPVVQLVIRACLGALLLSAACHKMIAPTLFSTALNGYRIVPVKFLKTATFLLALLESSLGLALLYSAFPISGSLACLLFAAYGAALAYPLVRGRAVGDCGCAWGNTQQPVTIALVARNAGLAGLALVLTIPARSTMSGPVVWLATLLLTTLSAVLYVLLHALVTNHISTRKLFHD